MQRAICCRIFTPAARPEYPARLTEGLLLWRSHSREPEGILRWKGWAQARSVPQLKLHKYVQLSICILQRRKFVQSEGRDTWLS
jgi:hypothetical protein